MELRISGAALLVVAGLLVPLVVEFRTVLAFFGIDVGVLESLALGVVLFAVVLAWAIRPGENGCDAEPTS